jgi:GNAT superfamily N-acetyltransferase
MKRKRYKIMLKYLFFCSVKEDTENRLTISETSKFFKKHSIEIRSMFCLEKHLTTLKSYDEIIASSIFEQVKVIRAVMLFSTKLEVHEVKEASELTDFIKSINSKYFRYFQFKNMINILSEHIVTLLFQHKGKIIGYTHLRREKNKIYFGIYISPEQRGKRLSSKMLEYTLLFNVDNPKFLSVNIENTKAKNVYFSNGFVQYEEDRGICFMSRAAMKRC